MSNAGKKYTITFLTKDLNRFYSESGIVSDKNDSTIRAALAGYLLDNGFSGVNVKPDRTNQTLQELKAKVLDEQEEIANTNLIRKEDVLQLIDEAINE